MWSNVLRWGGRWITSTFDPHIKHKTFKMRVNTTTFTVSHAVAAPVPCLLFPFASSLTIPSPPCRPDLVWDAYLAANELKWAKHLAETGPFQHEGMRGEGEKLFMQIGGAHATDEGVDGWVDEKNYPGQKISEGGFAN
jgi:Cysteine-rich secretory protein family